MIRKLAIVSAAVGAALVLSGGLSAAEADPGVDTVNGNAASQVYGNQKIHGAMSPQLGLVQRTLNEPCIGLPAHINSQNIVALVNVGMQDINVLNPQNQQCTAVQGDASSQDLENILSNIPILSGSGRGGPPIVK